MFRRHVGVYYCPACHHVQAADTGCAHCGEDAAELIPLARGLVSLDTANDWGIVHYEGERLVEALALGLVLLFPTAAALSLTTDLPTATALLGMFFVGLPILALVDAKRAGMAVEAVELTMPDVFPDVPGPGPASRGVRFCGVARRIRGTDGDIPGPVSDQRGLAVRFDIRAGQHAELVARHLDGVEFMVTADDGTCVLVTGTVEIEADAYGTIAGARDTSFALGGVSLLPVSFTDGGWACELLVREGDRIEIRGTATGELRANPLGALYRDAGAIPVMHGRPGHPVSIRVV